MSTSLPSIPPGNGRHPILMVSISAHRLADSAAFYQRVFGWTTQPVAHGILGAQGPAGPYVTLRADTPEGFPGVVPFLAVDDVTLGLKSVEAHGGRTEKAPWTVPMAGTLARFADPGGTLYGLMAPATRWEVPVLPVPFGGNPKPPAGAVCSIEMYAADGHAAAGFFAALFGWGTAETMPQYVMFDPGAGLSGVFQSHTPTLPALAYIYVADVAATLAEIDAAGGKRTAEPMSAPGMGTFGYFTDPSGTHMGLIGP